MPGTDLDDRLDRLLRTVQDGVAAGDPVAVVRRGRRRRLARRTAGVGAVAVLLAAVVIVSLLPDRGPRPAAPPVATGPTAAGVPDGVVAWSDARPSGNPGELVVTVQAGVGARSHPSDPCWEGYQPEARAEAGRMVVTIQRFRSRATLPQGQGCAAVGVLWNVTVSLPEDLRGRPLVDGATGQRRPLVKGLLVPGWLPEGWQGFKTGRERGGRWRRSYGWAASPKAGAVTLPPVNGVEVAAISPKILWGYYRLPDTPVVGYTQVRGHRAEIDAVSRNRNRDRYVNVRWREGEVGYVVTGDVRWGATLRQAQEVVVRIAQSLR
jgi:hypothetical protein